MKGLMARKALSMKPKFSIPTMEEIARIPWNGKNVASTFSGCGGSSLGYKMAGYKVLWANEFIGEAQKCYEANHQTTILDKRNIRNIKGSEILETIGIQRGELDILDGSPPCASFSTAGNREKDWGKVKKYSDTNERTDDLFFEYARIIKETMPKVFIAENVKGLTIGEAKNLLGTPQLDMFDSQEDTIYHTLANLGYRVKFRVLNAQNYGVPQARQRAIFVGVRNDLNKEPEYPDSFGYYYSVKDAIWDLSHTEAEIKEATHKEGSKVLSMVRKLKQGQSGDSLEEANGSYFGLVRINETKPSPTICQRQGNKGACLIHPTEDRELTVKELARLSTFPDDFIFTGNYKQKCERIGRAVPPLMMKAISLAILEKVFNENT